MLEWILINIRQFKQVLALFSFDVLGFVGRITYYVASPDILDTARDQFTKLTWVNILAVVAFGDFSII